MSASNVESEAEMADDKMSDLIATIHEAALAPDLWPNVLESMRSVLDSQGAVLVKVNTSGNSSYSYHAGLDPTPSQAMKERYYTPESSPIFQSMLAGPILEVIPREALASDTSFAWSDYYNDVFRPQDMWHSVAACLERSENEIVAIGVARSKRVGIYNRHETILVQRLAKHIRLATNVMARIGALGAKLADREAVLNQLSDAVFLVDRIGRMFYANKVGADLLDAADGLSLDGSRVKAVRHADTLRLLATVQRVVDGSGDGTPPVPISFGLPRISSPQTYALTVLPLYQRDYWPTVPGAEAAIIIHDTEKPIDTSEDRLRQIYKLTPRETALAQAFLATCDLRAASDRLGISTNTAKTQLKSIFAKTSTTSQAALIKLLMAPAMRIR